VPMVHGTALKGATGITAADEKRAPTTSGSATSTRRDLDIIIGQLLERRAVLPERDRAAHVPDDMGFAGPGSMALTMCGGI